MVIHWAVSQSSLPVQMKWESDCLFQPDGLCVRLPKADRYQRVNNWPSWNGGNLSLNKAISDKQCFFIVYRISRILKNYLTAVFFFCVFVFLRRLCCPKAPSWVWAKEKKANPQTRIYAHALDRAMSDSQDAADTAATAGLAGHLVSICWRTVYLGWFTVAWIAC